MNIFQRLREDHDMQRQMIQSLIETQGDCEARKMLFEHIKLELQAHAVAEERVLYVPLLESNLAQDKARHAIAEHHEIDELIEDLEEISNASPAWLVKAKALSDKVNHHLNEEEHKFFQIAGKVLSTSDKDNSAVEFDKQKNNYIKNC